MGVAGGLCNGCVKGPEWRSLPFYFNCRTVNVSDAGVGCVLDTFILSFLNLKQTKTNSNLCTCMISGVIGGLFL